MLDGVYLLATVLFFALMIAYVAGCARLGRASDRDAEAHDESR
jgi:hypothetical protein